MRRTQMLVLAAAVSIVSHTAMAVDGVCAPPSGSAYGSALMLCCPDDFCRKPVPCVPCALMTDCCDDYRCKPLPCLIKLPPCCCAEDYCRKPLPSLCWPRLSGPLSCGAHNCTGGAVAD